MRSILIIILLIAALLLASLTTAQADFPAYDLSWWTAAGRPSARAAVTAWVAVSASPTPEHPAADLTPWLVASGVTRAIQ
jgi:hypothetical protein